jgi:flagellar motor switch protein FliM
MGRLSSNPPGPRRPTRTDASMSADFIDSFLTLIEEALACDDAVIWAGGFRYASYLDDPRPLGLLLEDVSYRVYRLRLKLGAAATRETGLLWAVPATGRGPAPQRPGPPADAMPDADPGAPWADRMEGAVADAHVVLDAVLHRLTLPLSAVLGLTPGAEIPLPADALETLRIEGAGGRRICAGRLGQARGQRAARLVLPEDGAAAPEASAPAEGPQPSVPLRTTAPGFLADHSRNEAHAFDSDLGQLQAGADLPPLRVGAF